MVDQITNLGESTEEIVGENLDPKVEIRSGANENIAGNFQDEKVDSEESKEITKQDLLNKSNMTATDKENMQKSISYLQKNKMDTEENLKKLAAINYGLNYIEIGSVKFSREKLVPEVGFSKNINKYGVFECYKKGIFKTLHYGKEEYYFTSDEYIVETKKQGKKEITDNHIRKALQALPGIFSDKDQYQGANILGNILNLSMSGYVSSIAKLWDEYEYGSICFANHAGSFEFYENQGRFYNYNRGYAHPCLFVVE